MNSFQGKVDFIHDEILDVNHYPVFVAPSVDDCLWHFIHAMQGTPNVARIFLMNETWKFDHTTRSRSSGLDWDIKIKRCNFAWCTRIRRWNYHWLLRVQCSSIFVTAGFFFTSAFFHRANSFWREKKKKRNSRSFHEKRQQFWKEEWKEIKPAAKKIHISFNRHKLFIFMRNPACLCRFAVLVWSCGGFSLSLRSFFIIANFEKINHVINLYLWLNDI